MKLRIFALDAALLSLVAIALSTFPTPLLAQNVQVTSATPNSAAQGSINLNVVVGGSGFKKGASATWFVSGTTNPGGVVVNSTAFNSSGQLTANITVSDTADLSSYDIVVTNTDGRSGKGTKLFTVTQKGAPTGCSGSGGQNFNVTSIFADTDSSNLPFQLQSDGKGPYSTYKNSKTDSVTSEIVGGSCDWVLDVTSSKSRTVKLSLADLDGGATLPTGWPTNGSPVNVPAQIIAKCENNPLNNGVGVGAMTSYGQTLQCAMHATFYFNGILYSVRMNPDLYAGATWEQVACTGAASSQCNAWTVTPIPNATTNPYTGQASAIAELVEPSCYGCVSGTPLGLYYVSFSITITKP